ncbi:hypothetical protein H2O64_22640 [Kordia sp. YSTF-M3]|uniref:Uncharacterized protein n=1 Tax=Kordia aestuariivivens TaxID=2759037 RepID=A0ABR7QFY3_9FLAO|nr:hypothetical protein [Kordia aestuariivivens]MBC8757486.1 hypothetical protein [Kordia aestuariivivens]
MKGKETLAGYDMVLALSENTINYQFQELHKRNIIHKKWGILSGKTKVGDKNKDFHITDSNADFKKKLKRWIDLQKQITEARKNNKWSEIGRLVALVESENINFDFGWDANLVAPTISIIQKDPKNLILQISFKSGKLYHRAEETSAVESFNLKGLVYAFTVPIGQLKVTKDQMIMDAGDQVENVIRDSGLTAQDFTIESLFLNFQDANISTFDKNKSTFPQEASLAFQVAIENYFNIILHDDEHPYVLGYSIQRKKIKATEKAMFQPTSLGYSTSHSNHNKKPGQFSSLNFLMMLNDTKPPTNTTAGILPASLIELGKDLTSTTDGVFGLQKNHFNIYVKSLDAYVQTTFENLKGVKLSHGFENNVMVLTKNDKHIDDKIDTTYTVTREYVQNDGNQGIAVRYRIDIKVEVHVIMKLFGEHEVKYLSLSTSGEYTKDNVKDKGASGYLDFTITTKKTGRFDLDHNFTKPKVAYDSDPNFFSGDVFAIILKVISLVITWVFAIVDAVVNQIAVDLGGAGSVSSTKLIEQLNDIDVLNQTNKIILPLGKVYTFKNLRIEDKKDIVAYDITYAPTIEKQN